MSKVYTEEGMIAQALIAFGQGMGAVRISHDTAVLVRALYSKLLAAKKEEIFADWEKDGVHALERVRAAGRAAANKLSLRAGTMVSSEDVEQAVREASVESSTGWC